VGVATCRALAVLLLSVQVARAAEPPDPRRGERHDGRTVTRTPRDRALFVPRLVLAPIRLVIDGVAYQARMGMEFEQRHHVMQRLTDALTSEDGLIGVRPVISWALSFQPSAGLHFFHDRLLGPGTAFNLTFTTGGPEIIFAHAHLRPTPARGPVQARFDVVFDRRNDRIYSGISGETPELGIARYASDMVDVRSDVALQAAWWLRFDLGGGFGFRRFGPGTARSGDRPINELYCPRVGTGRCINGFVSEALVPGFNEGTQFLRTSVGLHLDTRDNGASATSGLLVDARADYSHGLGFDPSSYLRLRGAAAVPINLWQNSRVLVLRGLVAWTTPLNDEIVPFTELTTLGGPDLLPGFRWDRFRGYTALVASAEYRWPIWMWADGMIFGDWGGTFGRDFHDIAASRMHGDIGVGLRMHSTKRFFVRLQVAYGFGEGFQFYISGSPTP
jgi:hypothetical protein